jgi:hypothetical protein
MSLKGRSCWDVNIRMHAAEEWTLEAIGWFVAASEEIRFEAENHPQLYEWMERVLVEQTLSNWVQAHREGALKGARGKPQVSAEQRENSRLRGGVGACHDGARHLPPHGQVFVRGVEYASDDFSQVLQGHGITPSMSRKGNCWDNACSETLFGSLKVERLHDQRFEIIREAKDKTIAWLLWYNKTRMHSTLKYVSPMQFEQDWTDAAVKIAA